MGINWAKLSVHLVVWGGVVIQAVITMAISMDHTIMATHHTTLVRPDSMVLVTTGIQYTFIDGVQLFELSDMPTKHNLAIHVRQLTKMIQSVTTWTISTIGTSWKSEIFALF